ncbi:MAG: hypothetical protein NVSMB26_21890 [Beijerinckiaceae bacterium]
MTSVTWPCCLEHHDAAHSTSTLSQNLTDDVVANHKARWEAEVKRLDARSIIDAMKVDYSSWTYINELRLFELVRELSLDATEATYYSAAKATGLIDKHGLPLPTSTKTFYKYEGQHILIRYAYMKEVLDMRT